MIKLRKEDKLMPNSNKKIKPKKTEAKEKDVEQKPKTSKKETKLKAQKKKIYKDFRFWICVGVLGAVLIAVIVFLIINDKQHKEAVTKYEDAWKTYAKAQNEFGYEFGAMLGEMGFSTDGSTEYNIDSSAQNDISTKCAQKVGIYDEVYNNPYAVEDKNISVKILNLWLSDYGDIRCNASISLNGKEKSNFNMGYGTRYINFRRICRSIKNWSYKSKRKL